MKRDLQRVMARQTRDSGCVQTLLVLFQGHTGDLQVNGG